MIDSIYKKDKNYYPQEFLEWSRYDAKEQNKFITDDIEISPDYSGEESFDQDN